MRRQEVDFALPFWARARQLLTGRPFEDHGTETVQIRLRNSEEVY